MALGVCFEETWWRTDSPSQRLLFCMMGNSLGGFWMLTTWHGTQVPSFFLMFHVGLSLVKEDWLMAPRQVLCLVLIIWTDSYAPLMTLPTPLRWTKTSFFILAPVSILSPMCLPKSETWTAIEQEEYIWNYTIGAIDWETTNGKCLPTGSSSDKEESYNT